MNTHIIRRFTLALALTGALAWTLPAWAGTVRYNAASGSKVKIEGTSSIHDWTMDGAIIGGYMEVDEGFPESALAGGAAAKPKVEVKIPVSSLKSYAKKMDEVMQEAMEMAKFRIIEYKLVELKPAADSPKTGALKFDAVGELTVHGVKQPLTMPVTIEKQADGKIKVLGKTKLKMTSFGVKPPEPNLPMGMIKTGDEITLSLEWLTAKAAQ